MTPYSRSLPARRTVTPTLALFAVLTAVFFAALAASAHAIVQTVATPSGPTEVGVTPPSNAISFGETGGFANNSGNPVMHANNVFAIYWDPQDQYHGNWQQLIDGFLRNVADTSADPIGRLSNHYGLDAQYSDRSNGHAAYNSTFRGAYTDTNHYPSPGCTDPNASTPESQYDFGFITCITDQQIREELLKFTTQAEPSAPNGLPRGMTSLFFILTPPGVAVCIDAGGVNGHCSDNPPAKAAAGVCSYHAALGNGDANTIIYAAIPWTAGGLNDGHLPHYELGKPQLYETLGSACQDGNWDGSEPNLDSQREGTGISPEPVAEQQPNQLIQPKKPDGYFDEGLADLIINQVSVEHQNAITNPLLNAWQDGTHSEVMDKCRNDFLPILGGSESPQANTNAGTMFNQVIGESSYYLNDNYNLAGAEMPYPGVACGWSGVNLVPAFTGPSTINAGDLASFNGQESDITLDWGRSFSTSGEPQVTYPTYTWDFGDGSADVSGYAPGANSPGVPPCSSPWLSPCAAGVFHSYQYGGTYQVTLTVKDVAGNVASVANAVNVIGPEAPAPGGGAGEGANGSGNTTGSTTAPGGSTQTTPGPIVKATASSTSLAATLRKGLAIRYTVSEQVAGHFEVLLPTKLARHLGIRGSAAHGLPAGTAPSLVIAHAILVTTKAGHNTVHIKFSKATAARLHRLRKVTLTLRLIVHNASTQNPQSTTEMTTIVLHR